MTYTKLGIIFQVSNIKWHTIKVINYSLVGFDCLRQITILKRGAETLADAILVQRLTRVLQPLSQGVVVSCVE